MEQVYGADDTVAPFPVHCGLRGLVLRIAHQPPAKARVELLDLRDVCPIGCADLRAVGFDPPHVHGWCVHSPRVFREIGSEGLKRTDALWLWAWSIDWTLLVGCAETVMKAARLAV